MTNAEQAIREFSEGEQQTDDWQCPNCGEFWSIEEFDTQRCGSCGYPDYDEDDEC